MVQIVEVLNNYKTKLFFYLFEGTQEMLGIDENSKTLGYHDPTRAEIVTLNRDFARGYEQFSTLYHEIGHGVRPKDSETMRRYGDSVGYYGVLEYKLVA